MVGRYRWVICALLFFATTINYIDRQVLGILAPDLQRSIGWSEVEYGRIVTAFQFAYALGLLVAGRLLDLFGTRLGFAVAIVLWSLAAMGHALARNALGFSVARFALGLGEAANFPAAIKTVAEWFPKRERAFATGIFNAGSNIGAVVAPAVVPWIALTWGWQWAFILTGAIGFAWLVRLALALSGPRRGTSGSAPPSSPSSGATLRSRRRPVAWSRLMGYRQTWAFAIGKFMTDPIWWFYLFWLPKFFNERHGLSLAKLGPPLIAIYLIADVGSIGGGWLSSFLIKRGWSINAARKTAMLVCALCVVPIVFAPSVEHDLGGGRPHQPRRGGPPGMVGQPLHPRLRHVPPPRRGLGRGLRGHGGLDRRHAHRHGDGLSPTVDRQLRVHLPRGGLDLPRRPCHHPFAGTARGAGRAAGRRRGPMKTSRVSTDDLRGVFPVPPLAAARTHAGPSTGPRTSGSCAT